MDKGITVISLFDGMSCGQIALNQLDIKVDSYYASEIDKYAMKIANKNYPNTIQIGDVRNVYYNDGVLYTDNGEYEIDSVDLLIGGSPCTNFSFMGKRNGMVTDTTIEITTLTHYLKLKNEGFEFQGQSYLFWEYMRIMTEIKPKYFLLENVRMSKKWKNILSTAIGVEPISINSSLFSAQTRNRLYWTNTNVDVSNIISKNLTFKDIREDVDYKEWKDYQMVKYHNKEYVRKDYYRIETDDKPVQCLMSQFGMNHPKNLEF